MNKPTEVLATSEKGASRKVFDRLKDAYRRQPYIDLKTRLDTLKKIEEILIKNEAAICETISQDFGNRSFHETKILEIIGSISGLRYTRKKLKKWIKPQKRHVSVLFFGAKNVVIPQAKGVVGIVTPWNYPLFLSLSPLTSVIAAGNRAMIKLASNSQNLCVLLQSLFSKHIPDDIVTFLPGVGASEFSSLPFDHLVFTGSPDVGRTIMKSASQHLTPVTLELGGKSPTIITEDYDILAAVDRIMYSKLVNSGQMCVAPDYLFVPANKVETFIEAAKATVFARYSELESKDYTSIIDQKAYDRLMDTLQDARKKGAEIINLLPGDENKDSIRKISPLIAKNVTEEMRLMQEEIFGPILPIKTYDKIDEVIDYINSHERPLALYIYSNNKKVQEKLLAHTMSGGVSINDCAMHVGQHDMPFGGIGNSGMGQYHGLEGFMEFSKMRPVFKQAKRALSLAPPYGDKTDRIYNFVTKMKRIS